MESKTQLNNKVETDFTFRVPLTEMSVRFISGEFPEKLLQSCKLSPVKYRQCYGLLFSRPGSSVVNIWVEKEDCATIVHESTHAMFEISRITGITGEEIKCRILAFIVTKILNKIK